MIRRDGVGPDPLSFIGSYDGAIERFARISFSLATFDLGHPFSVNLFGVFLGIFSQSLGEGIPRPANAH